MNKGFISVISMGVGSLLGGVAGATITGKNLNEIINKEHELSERHLALFMLMNQWVKVKQDNKSLSQYLAKRGYNSIAIYGMSFVGETLLNELTNSEIEVKYGIDKKADEMYANIDLLNPKGELPHVDAVIVTSITFYDEIVNLLSQKISCPILSLEDILDVI